MFFVQFVLRFLFTGYFSIDGYCLSDLQLTFNKIGFMSKTVSVSGTTGDEFVVLLKLTGSFNCASFHHLHKDRSS